MPLPNSAECPHAASGIALLRHDYDQVAAAFEGGVSCPLAPVERRGGYVRPKRTPRPFFPGKKTAAKAVTHVESSFTAQQQAYIGLCVAGLHKLARGEVLRTADPAPLPLSEQVQLRFLGDTATRFWFDRSLANSTAAVFEDFGTLYPNLTPALGAMYYNGAVVEGITLAITDAQYVYTQLLKGKPTQSFRLGPDASSHFFTGRPLQQDSTSHEVWCPGEAFAKTILRQAGQAATALAENPEVIAVHEVLFENHSTRILEIRSAISASIENAIMRAEPTSPDV